MSSNISDDKNTPTDAEACYETVASQEEIYLEETEEELRAILIFDDLSPSPMEAKISMSDASDNSCIAERLDEQRGHAAEELITGDPDDPPLSAEDVVEMLRMAKIARGLGRA